MTASHPERRYAQRVPVGMYLDQLESGESHRYFANNLSESGLYMERPVASFVRHSKHVHLQIPLPGEEEPLWAAAEVVYDCFDGLFHGTAVRFTGMGDRDRERLSSFLELQAATGPAAA